MHAKYVRFLSQYRVYKIIMGIAAACLCLPVIVIAAEQGLEINKKMAKIGQTINLLLPSVVDEDEIQAKQHAAQNEQYLIRLIDLFSEVKPHIQVKSSTYRVSYNVIMNHLLRTRYAFKSRNIRYAQLMTRQIPTICISCHMQDDRKRTLFGGKKRSDFKSDLQYAEYNYITRNYDVARAFYDKFLLGDHSQLTENKILSVMNRLLVIDTQILNQPKKTAQQLTHYLNLDKHTAYTLKTNKAWIEALNQLAKSEDSKKSINSLPQLEALIERYFKPVQNHNVGLFQNKKRQVIRVWLRGQIYRYLNASPALDEVPVLLYWLAVMDRAIDYNYFYSFSDLYLKECMLNYTRHPYAAKCYEEYKDYIEFSYTGSRGTDIPKEIQAELDELQKIVLDTK